MNFLQNAVKFSVAGSVVTIEVESAVKIMQRKINDLSTSGSRGRNGGLGPKILSLSSVTRRNSRVSAQASRGSTRIVPSSSNSNGSMRYVTVIVSDMGVGIPEGDHGK